MAVTLPQQGSWALDLKGDANNAYIDCNYTAASYGIDHKKPRTITAWAYTHTFDANFNGLYEIGGHAANGQDFALLTSGDEPNVWRANHEGGAENWDFDFEYPSKNTWVHFAQTYDGTTARVYVDGYALGEAKRVVDLNTTNEKHFSIGRYSSYGSNYFDGKVDDVRIYNIALSQANAAYIAGRATFTQPLYLLLLPHHNPAINLYNDSAIDFRDIAEMGKHWNETQVWPTW